MLQDDQKALHILGEHYHWDHGVIRRINQTREPTKEEWQAIYLLCDEWDWAYIHIGNGEAKNESPS